MPIKISNRAKSIKPSPTLSISSKAKEMKAEGIDVINFGVGEPDFNTPEYIKNAAKKAIDDNFTRYTAAAGIKELRESISAKLKKDNGLDCNINDILVSPGAKVSIVNILLAVCDPRDEVLIPSPYWVSYTSQVGMVDANPVILPTDESTNFKIDAVQLEEAIASNCTPKALILNSPNNPTGAVYTKKELTEIGEVCLRNNILIISDEIYEKLIYDDVEHFSIASISPEIREMTVLINGVSKAYAMTGWRLGYAAGPTEIIKRATRIQSHTTSCVNSMTQKAVVTALTEDDGSIEKMRRQFEKRRNILVEGLNKIKNVKCALPKGAFYALPNISYYLYNNKKGIGNSVDLCKYLLEENHIAIVPGSAFGVDNYVRFSYANSIENIEEGVKRFEDGLESLLKK
ncbi:MAG: pyridoxal phosphate-dependent aminotransferase [Candidatus Cloacimonetes bacterium]|nr:pyridoxal phosphate-dependent aminotransferase [Candidatus Cloacimonadota bacterium]